MFWLIKFMEINLLFFKVLRNANIAHQTFRWCGVYKNAKTTNILSIEIVRYRKKLVFNMYLFISF